MLLRQPGSLDASSVSLESTRQAALRRSSMCMFGPPVRCVMRVRAAHEPERSVRSDGVQVRRSEFSVRAKATLITTPVPRTVPPLRALNRALAFSRDRADPHRNATRSRSRRSRCHARLEPPRNPGRWRVASAAGLQLVAHLGAGPRCSRRRQTSRRLRKQDCAAAAQ